MSEWLPGGGLVPCIVLLDAITLAYTVNWTDTINLTYATTDGISLANATNLACACIQLR